MDAKVTLSSGKVISLFDIVDRIFDAWSGYQLAIDHQTGGPDTPAKDEWLRRELTNYIFNNPTPLEDDIVDWLDTVLDTEFDLRLEDNSVDVSSRGFFLAATNFKKSDLQALESLWNQIPEKKKVEAKVVANYSDSDDDTSNDDEPMEEDDDGNDRNRKSRYQSRNEPDEDGWITVKRH